MRLIIRALVSAALIASSCPLSLLAQNTTPACIQRSITSAFAGPAGLSFLEEPIFLNGPCTVNRNCEHGLQTNISCSSTAGVCSSGPDNYAWVECDGARTYCPPPAPCSGTCFSSVQCYAICSAGGAEPVLYPCDRVAHCCRSYY